MTALADAQRRLWRLIAHPEGVRAALAEERGAPPLASLVASDGRLAAEDRLEVYANAYFYRILDVLRDDFPVLAAALGDDAFHDLATSYLAVHPSEDPSLRWIGRRLPAFLRDGPAAAGVRSRAPFAPDLAALEWAKGDVFDEADAETGSREDLEGVPAEAFDALALALVPAVRLLSLAWPVDRLRADADGAPAAAAALAPEAVRLCVFRRDERAHWRRVDAVEHDALSRARDGVRFGALCELAAERAGDDAAPALAAGWLARWLDDGLLRPLAR